MCEEDVTLPIHCATYIRKLLVLSAGSKSALSIKVYLVVRFHLLAQPLINEELRIASR